mgnify:CR=1 FL=1
MKSEGDDDDDDDDDDETKWCQRASQSAPPSRSASSSPAEPSSTTAKSFSIVAGAGIEGVPPSDKEEEDVRSPRGEGLGRIEIRRLGFANDLQDDVILSKIHMEAIYTDPRGKDKVLGPKTPFDEVASTEEIFIINKAVTPSTAKKMINGAGSSGKVEVKKAPTPDPKRSRAHR